MMKQGPQQDQVTDSKIKNSSWDLYLNKWRSIFVIAKQQYLNDKGKL